MEMINAGALRYKVEDERQTEVISIGSCADAASCSVVDVQPASQGRMMEIGVRVRRVCPGKRVALGVLLYELDETDAEYVRGMKAMTLPAHHESCCRDVIVEGVRFVLPEDVSMSSDGGSCGERRFRVHVQAHYMDVSDACGNT